MAGKVYPLEPRKVAKVQTKYRKIVTDIPVPDAMPILKDLRKYEPACMEGQPPVFWDKAEGVTVSDKWGNQWLDFSSGVLIANAGHGRKEIVDAIVKQVQAPLLTTYCFPNESRAKLVKKLVELAPKGLDKCFLISTGSEAVECVIKLSRTHGEKIGGPKKHVIVSFERAFHGRTLGSQQAGGIPELKTWIQNLDPGFVQVPFPDGFRTKDTSFSLFEKTLADHKIDPNNVAGVVVETYQGGGADFGPPEYFQQLRKWCDKYNVVMVFDEVQAGFGRCGTFWGFEYYGVTPDLFSCGKGISSSLPLSAVIGKSEIMNLYGPGSMTSTHTGNPVCCAAALANVELILKEKLTENSAKVGAVMQKALNKLIDKYAGRVGAVHGRGLVAGVHLIKKGSEAPDTDLAWNVVRICIEKGVLFFAPVGFGSATLKICPPLCITEEAMLEGVGVIDEAIGQAIAEEGK
jgi:4-aminobutyrate aminotransferase/diaminobutyrate-pyruvate transaminase/4-aminobutyrate aminotransferase/(S)-3-amino-2-methylpropionate transaminase